MLFPIDRPGDDLDPINLLILGSDPQRLPRFSLFILDEAEVHLVRESIGEYLPHERQRRVRRVDQEGVRLVWFLQDGTDYTQSARLARALPSRSVGHNRLTADLQGVISEACLSFLTFPAGICSEAHSMIGPAFLSRSNVLPRPLPDLV